MLPIYPPPYTKNLHKFKSHLFDCGGKGGIRLLVGLGDAFKTAFFFDFAF